MIIPGKKKYLYFILFILPALFCSGLFLIVPFIRTVQYSFTNWNGVEPPRFTGLKNFRNMFDPRIDQHFTPSTNTHYLFRVNYELPLTIDAAIYRDMLVKHIKDKNELDLLEQAYTKQYRSKYILNEGFNEFRLYERLTRITGLGDKGLALLKELKTIISLGQPAMTGLEKAPVNPALFQRFTTWERTELVQIVNRYSLVFDVKKILGKYLVRKQIMPGATGFTLLYSVINVLCANLAAFLFAVGLSRNTLFRRILRSFFLLPAVMSSITISFTWYFLLHKILPVVTGVETWIGNPELAPLLVSIAGAWRSSSCLVLIYLAGLQSIPRAYTEAASIEGAGILQQFFQITVPLLLPVFTIGIFWSLITSLQVFDISFGLTGTSGYVTNAVSMVQDIYINAFTGHMFGYAAAKALVLFLAVSIPTGIYLFILKKRGF